MERTLKKYKETSQVQPKKKVGTKCTVRTKEWLKKVKKRCKGGQLVPKRAKKLD
jgi:hypothetical protein